MYPTVYKFNLQSSVLDNERVLNLGGLRQYQGGNSMRQIVLRIVVLAVAAPAGFAQAGSCTPFFDQSEFQDFNTALGMLLRGVETNEESNIYPMGKQPLPAPLDQNPNTVFGIGFPKGLEQPNIIVWDNMTPGANPPFLNPSGSDYALYVIGPGFFGATSKKVGGDLFIKEIQGSLDLVFTDPQFGGVGLELSWFFFRAGWHVSIYDRDNQTIGLFEFAGPPGPEPQITFFGVSCDPPIGRINIYDDSGPWPNAIDNVEMWL